MLKLAFQGTMKYWGVSVKNNPNYAALTSTLGHDENDWINRRILLNLKEDDFYQGKFYVEVTFPKGKTKA